MVADKAKLANQFLTSLEQPERMLVILRDELYEKSWDLMINDLKARLNGEPFIFKLADKIDKDLQSVEKIRTFENQNDINLGDFVNLASEGLN